MTKSSVSWIRVNWAGCVQWAGRKSVLYRTEAGEVRCDSHMCLLSMHGALGPVLSTAQLDGHSGVHVYIILAGRRWRQKDQGFEVLFV